MATKPSTWSDVQIDLDRQADGDIERDIDVQAILNSLTNIIMTIQGERRMLPTFASPIAGLLFEPIDEITAELLANFLIESIEFWEDRIELTGFDIEPVPDENIYRCRINFLVLGSDKVQNIDFILSR